MSTLPFPHGDHSVVVLIATRGRNDLLVHRAIPSVLAQTRPPNALLVVVDQSKAELPDVELRALKHRLASQCGGGFHVTVLRNRRTAPRAAGAWNTGLDHLHRDPRIGARADRCFVAILDDDDHWDAEHLQTCLTEAVDKDRHMVATGLVRHESPDDAGLFHAVPSALDAREQFIRGQHIQGSNLFVRLDMLLKVGMFDEHLPSCTDRDFCIRLTRLPGLRFGSVSRHTVHHHADPRPDRLSTRASPTKLDGLTRFFAKHAERFDAEARAEAQGRAAKLFGWTPTSLPPASAGVPASAPVDERMSFVVGLVTDAQPPKHVEGLLDDLVELSTRAGIAALKVIVVENGPLPDGGSRPLHTLVARYRALGLDVDLVSLERQREDWTQGRLIDTPNPMHMRLRIAVSRTVLNTYVARAAVDLPGCCAWILDDDKRLQITVDQGDGAVMVLPSPDLGALLALRRSGVDVVLGPDTGSAPLPFTATLRMQLLDLEQFLGVLAAGVPADAWPDRNAANHRARAVLKDSYYDLSQHTEHLETPFAVSAGSPEQSAYEVLATVAAKVERLLAGEAVFRPLVVEASSLPVDSAFDSVHRGGSTIFFDPSLLLEYPQSMARFGEMYVRRSDMLVTLFMRDQLGRKIVMHPAAGVRHDRSCTHRTTLDDATLLEDILGYALYRTIHELNQQRRKASAPAPLLGWTAEELRRAIRLTRKYLEERLAAVTLNGWRIFALTDAIRDAIKGLGKHPSWSNDAVTKHLLVIAREIDHIQEQFRPSKVQAFAARIRDSVTDDDIVNTFASMDGLISEYRATAPAPTTSDERRSAARERRARALIERAWRLRSLRLLGAGGEGVVFTDEQHVFKVLDLVKRRPNHDTWNTLCALRDRLQSPQHLYPLSRLEVADETILLAYPFEPSSEYAGGHGPELVGLLRECKANGVVFRNMHPKNLRVSAKGLKLIDYGSDIRSYSEAGYRSMAERAWLCWRWPHRQDLDQVMRRMLNDKSLPEMDGFERFWQALNDDHASATSTVAAIVEPVVLERRAASVLDYGCGKKAFSVRRFAEAGLRTVGFDPGAGLQDQWSAAPKLRGDVQLTNDRGAALARGPFDAVICSMVLCELDDGPAYERVLEDFREAVASHGMLVVTVCNPFSTFGRPTPLHQRREVPVGAGYADSFPFFEVAESERRRREFHRPLRRLERDLLRHGFSVVRRIESRTVDLERFEPASDFMTLVCRPIRIAHPERRVSLLIKCCAMEAQTIERQVHHLTRQLEGARTFHERVLAVDSLRDGFVRQHAAADPAAFRAAAERLVRQGVIDRIVDGPEPGPEARRINQAWFALDCNATHTGALAPLAMPLLGIESCTGDYVLQVDSDLLIGRRDAGHDFVGEMLGALDEHPDALCTSLNIARRESLPFTADKDGVPWRVEVRGCLLHKARLLAARPFPNHVEQGLPVLSWHRSIDAAVDEGRGSSLRGGGHQSYFIHPPNDFKRSVSDWMFLLDAVEQGRIADAQFDRVDLAGGPLAWLPRNRPEDVVFLVTGRDVPPGRAARCLESLSTQKNQGWGAIVIDDGSSELSREHLSVALSPWADRVTLLQPRERRGQLANTAWAIRHVCTNPETVVVTLDLDDALLGSDVVDRVLAEHRRGADVTVGTMLRTDKDAKYPVNFEDPRSTRGGNVWQHLRSFRKRLFDAIPDHELRVDGRYADIAVDWAFMIPIVEAARNPVWIREPLYLYEPSGLGKGAEHDARERQIGALVTRPPRPRRSPEADSNLLTPCQIKPEVWAESGGVLFLRHGERHSFTGLSSSERDAVRLTETGRAAAFALGKKLGGCSGFVSSPMLRSVQTAAAIAEGANLGLVDVHRLQALVDFRVSDVDVFEAAKRRLGWAGMMAAWIDGSLPPNVLMPCETLARNALQSVFAASQQPRIVAVTHDYLIIALLTVLRGVRETAVPYLSGLFVSSQEARTLLEGDGR